MGESLTDALQRELEEELGIDDEVPVEGPVASSTRSPGIDDLVEARRPHRLRGRPLGRLARGGALRGRRRARPSPLQRRRPRHDRPAPADPALPPPLAARRSRRLSRLPLGADAGPVLVSWPPGLGGVRARRFRSRPKRSERVSSPTAMTPSTTFTSTIAMCVADAEREERAPRRLAAEEIEQAVPAPFRRRRA